MSDSPAKDQGDSTSKDKKMVSSSKEVWVSGLSSDARASDLQALFEKHGKVMGAKIITNTRIPGSRYYGLIVMESSEQVDKSIEMLNKTQLNGQTLVVGRERPSESSSSSASKSKAKSSNGSKSSSSKTSSSKGKDKEKSSSSSSKDKVDDKHSEKEKEREKDKSKSRREENGIEKGDRHKETSEKSKEVDKEKERGKDKDREKDKSRDKQRDKDSEKERKSEKDKERGAKEKEVKEIVDISEEDGKEAAIDDKTEKKGDGDQGGVCVDGQKNDEHGENDPERIEHEGGDDEGENEEDADGESKADENVVNEIGDDEKSKVDDGGNKSSNKDSKKRTEADSKKNDKKGRDRKSGDQSRDRKPSSSPRRRSPFRRVMSRRPFGRRLGRGGGNSRANPVILRRIETERVIRNREREREMLEARRRRIEIRQQRERERKQQEERERLEREKERLRIERERLERQKAEIYRLEREKARFEREKLERVREELRRKQQFSVAHRMEDGIRGRAPPVVTPRRPHDSRETEAYWDEKRRMTQRIDNVGAGSGGRPNFDSSVGSRFPEFDSRGSSSYDTRNDGYKRIKMDTTSNNRSDYADLRRDTSRHIGHDRDDRRGGTSSNIASGNNMGSSGYYRGEARGGRADSRERDRARLIRGAEDWKGSHERRDRYLDKSIAPATSSYGNNTRYSASDRSDWSAADRSGSSMNDQRARGSTAISSSLMSGGISASMPSVYGNGSNVPIQAFTSHTSIGSNLTLAAEDRSYIHSVRRF